MPSNYKLKLYQLLYCCVFLLTAYYLFEPVSISIWVVVVTFAIAAVIFDIRPIVLPSSDNLSLVSPLIFTVGILFGTPTIILMNVLTAIILFYLVRNKWVFHIFNCVQYSLSGVVGFWFYHLIETPSTSFIFNLPAFIAYSIVFFLCNIFFITTYLKLSQDMSYKDLTKIFFDRKIYHGGLLLL